MNTHRLALVLALLTTSACDGERATLIVQVRTDVVPVRDFAFVVTELRSVSGSLERDAALTVTGERNWGEGVRVAEIAELPAGEYRFDVSMRDDVGATVLTRPVRIEVGEGGVRVVTVLLSADCSGVMCPAPAGDPIATACVAGRCAPEECTEDNPSACEAECSPTMPCPDTMPNVCAETQCTPSGSCFVAPIAGFCPMGEVCDPSVGCVVVATPLDGGVDAGVDAGIMPTTCGDGTCRAPETAASCSAECAAISVSASTGFSCAALSDGSARCWGINTFGQLGDGTIGGDDGPRVVAIPSADITQVAGGGTFACALASSGAVYCWGSNSVGQLGSGSTGGPPDPVMVTGITSATQIAVGDSHACALISGGNVSCWGLNTLGQLGDTTTMDRPTPVGISITAATAIAAGANHTCAAVDPLGDLYCWGDNAEGQVGNGSVSSAEPVPTMVTSGIDDVAGGLSHTCAFTGAGALYCWGNGDFGQLGNGDMLPHADPTAVSTVSVRAVAASSHTCVLDMSGGMTCWGFGLVGQLGDGMSMSHLVPMPGGPGVWSIISAGIVHTCGIRSDGTVHCFGGNTEGELGDGTATPRPSPAEVVGLALP